MSGRAVPVDRTSPSGRAGRPHGLPARHLVGQQAGPGAVGADRRGGGRGAGALRPARWLADPVTYHRPAGARGDPVPPPDVGSDPFTSTTWPDGYECRPEELRRGPLRRVPGEPYSVRRCSSTARATAPGSSASTGSAWVRRHRPAGVPCAPPAPRARAERRLPHPCRSTGDASPPAQDGWRRCPVSTCSTTSTG